MDADALNNNSHGLSYIRLTDLIDQPQSCATSLVPMAPVLSPTVSSAHLEASPPAAGARGAQDLLLPRLTKRRSIQFTPQSRCDLNAAVVIPERRDFVWQEEHMSSNRIKSLALATAIATCAGVGLPSMADAHYRGARNYGWHSGWPKDWHRHRGWARYGCARPATYAYGGYGGTMGAAAYGRPPAYYGYVGEQGEGGVGLGAPTF